MKVNKRILFASLIVIIFAGNFVRYSHRAAKRSYCDFRVYYATGERFLKREDIYSRPEESITPFKYSPMFAMLVSPLSLFSKHAASQILFTLNFLALIIVIILAKKLIEVQSLSLKENVLLCFFSILLTFRFILQVWDSGQVNLIMFLLVLLGLYLLRKDRVIGAAACIAFSIMFKYMPAVFLPYFLVKRKFKAVFFILAFIAVFCFFPMLYTGVQRGADYLRVWIPSIVETSLDHGSWYDFKNQSLYSLFLRFFTKESPYDFALPFFSFSQGFGLSLLFASLIYLLILIPTNGEKENETIDYALLFLCMALFNPNAWMLNFVVLLFGQMLLVYDLIKNRFRDKFALGLVVAAFALTSLASESLVGNYLEGVFEQFSSVTLGTLVLIFALLRLKYRTRPLWAR
ncbi:MAG: glycosyltransferase family 87 protein [Candidatus Omnitrophota bacterium]